MADNLILWGVLGIMVFTAVMVVVVERPLTAVIYAGVLSTVAAFCYLLLGAPDVALAEAVIGSTISTVIYLVALKRYRLFTIFVLRRRTEDKQSSAKLERVLALIGRALRERDIEPHLLESSEPAAKLLSLPESDLVVEEREYKVVIHGEEYSEYLRLIRETAERSGMKDRIQLEDSLEDRISNYKRRKR